MLVFGFVFLMFVSFALVDLLCMLPLTKPAKTEANTHEKNNGERNEHQNKNMKTHIFNCPVSSSPGISEV